MIKLIARLSKKLGGNQIHYKYNTQRSVGNQNIPSNKGLV